jgi:hypothetical protein
MKNEIKARLIELREKKHIEKYGFLDERFKGLLAKFKSINNARSLEKQIKEFLDLKGHICDKTDTKGRKVSNKIAFVDVIGRNRVIGRDVYHQSTGTVGKADLSVQIHGVRVEMEIKWGKDRQSELQKEYQKRVEKDGGIYVIIKDMDAFIAWFDENEPKFLKIKEFKNKLF